MSAFLYILRVYTYDLQRTWYSIIIDGVVWLLYSCSKQYLVRPIDIAEGTGGVYIVNQIGTTKGGHSRSGLITYRSTKIKNKKLYDTSIRVLFIRARTYCADFVRGTYRDRRWGIQHRVSWRNTGYISDLAVCLQYIIVTCICDAMRCIHQGMRCIEVHRRVTSTLFLFPSRCAPRHRLPRCFGILLHYFYIVFFLMS